MKKVEAPTCKKDLQKFLGKVNFLRRFISNLSGKIYAFTPILRLKDEAEFTCHADVIKHMLQKPILSGRIGKWAYALVEYDLPNESLGAVRG